MGIFDKLRQIGSKNKAIDKEKVPLVLPSSFIDTLPQALGTLPEALPLTEDMLPKLLWNWVSSEAYRLNN